MKKIKVFLTLFLLLGSIMLFGQLNPVNNLFYQQMYDFGNPNCPGYNCFTLSWNAPENSADTLKGYNVYRDNDLWMFTQMEEVGCQGFSPCGYGDFFNHPLPFGITVKAIYNNDSVESVAVDTVYCEGLLINTKDVNKNRITVLKNPLHNGENISLLLPKEAGNECVIKILSLNGQLNGEYTINRVRETIINIPTGRLKKGMYVISVQIKDEVLSTKILIE